MISNKKLKKVLITIIIAVLIFTAVSFTATKIIYDGIFSRYDCGVTTYANELEETIAKRQSFSYPSGKNTLCGYLYNSTAENRKDTLIVLAPGHNACADSYLWQIEELLAYGWSVFAFDATGCCRSGGDSSVGFPQEVLDLKATLKYIENNNKLNYNNIVLLGHSCGGYAACCSLAYGYDVSAVISVSGINSAMEGVIGTSTQYIGNLAYGNYGFLWLYQAMIFGADTVNLRADKVLSSSNIPALIIHGEGDEQVPIDKYSIISHKSEIKNTATEYFVRNSPDNSGHTDLLFAKDGTADDEIIKKINDFLIKNIK